MEKQESETTYDHMADVRSDRCHCLKSEIEKQPNWDELKEIEKTRREILRRVELPFCKILMYWSGTCLKALSLDWLIWVTTAFYICLRIIARSWENEPEVMELLANADTSILGAFLSFFLVLFVNQTNDRFFDMYGFAKAVPGEVQNVAGIVSTKLPKEQASRIIRQMNAAHVIAYVGLGGPYTKSGFFDPLNKEYQLLTPKELKYIESMDMESGSAAFKELVTWLQRDVYQARKEGIIDSFEEAQLHAYILKFRGSMDAIYDFTDQPVHFFYLHFVCLLSALYLPLFAFDNAYAAGWGDISYSIELLYGLIVFIQGIFVVGLRILGQKMTDPFGDDLEDLSVITYVESTLINTRIILNANQIVGEE